MRVFVPLGIIAVLLACATAKPDATDIKTSLDILADVVSASSALARRTCDDREELEVAKVRSGETTVSQAKTAIEKIRTRCDTIREKVNMIRITHSRAAELFEAGRNVEARQEIDATRTLFRALTVATEAP